MTALSALPWLNGKPDDVDMADWITAWDTISQLEAAGYILTSYCDALSGWGDTPWVRYFGELADLFRSNDWVSTRFKHPDHGDRTYTIDWEWGLGSGYCLTDYTSGPSAFGAILDQQTDYLATLRGGWR